MFIIQLQGFRILLPDEEARMVIDSFKRAEVWDVSWDGKYKRKLEKDIIFLFGPHPDQIEQAEKKADKIPPPAPAGFIPPTPASVTDKDDDIPS